MYIQETKFQSRNYTLQHFMSSCLWHRKEAVILANMTYKSEQQCLFQASFLRDPPKMPPNGCQIVCFKFVFHHLFRPRQ